MHATSDSLRTSMPEPLSMIISMIALLVGFVTWIFSQRKEDRKHYFHSYLCRRVGMGVSRGNLMDGHYGTGPGIITISVDPNSTPDPRVASSTFGGRIFSVMQKNSTLP